MNPLLREAADSVRYGWVLGIMTVVFLGCFVAWVWWTCTPRNRQRLEEAARLPFSDGGDL
ncbi:MAG: cbb3-type cytochrome oxidase subunit 3 [Gemmatimonadota bacterium]